MSDWNVTPSAVGYALFFALFGGFAASMVVGSRTGSDPLAVAAGGVIAAIVFATIFLGAAYSADGEDTANHGDDAA